MDITFADETGKIPIEKIRETENLLQSAAGFLKIVKDTKMSVTSTDNAGVQVISRDYRDKGMPTDVTSFALGDEGEDKLPTIPDDKELVELPRNLDDLIISTERTAEQAAEYGYTLKREMDFLAVHDFLYSNGYDHMEPGDEKEMLGLQKKILDAYGLKR